MELNKIYNGESLEVLKTFPDESVDMCITSPPYYGLRDYGVEGQLGLEKSPDEYIDRLCTIFDEVRRVLKDTGTCWVNISDSYAGGKPGQGGSGKKSGLNCKRNNDGTFHENNHSVVRFKTKKLKYDVKPKSLLGVPERFVLEMQTRGWIRRNTIIWHKPKCMPSSVKDRFTVDFEYLYFFSKKPKYYFEQQTEPLEAPHYLKRTSNNSQGNGEKASSVRFGSPNINGRNMRTVWRITTKPYKQAHFAVFPEDLIETPIKAGCPTQICNQCQTPRIKEYSYGDDKFEGGSGKAGRTPEDMANSGKWQGDNVGRVKLGPVAREKTLKGYTDCGCGTDFHPGVVLDPFMGSGTTAAVSKRLGRNYIGIELNPEYIPLIKERLSNVDVSQSTLKSFKLDL
jgi:DNA modification methylase